jgi:thiol:disulfide interchange protein
MGKSGPSPMKRAGSCRLRLLAHRREIQMKTTIAILLVMGMLPPVAAEGVAWQPWSDDQFYRAGARGKLVLLDLSAEWCAFCRRMEATTWKDPEVVELVERYYLPVRVVDERHPKMAARYREHGRPALVIYDASGRELLRKRGYLKPQWMIWLLEAVWQEQKARNSDR